MEREQITKKDLQTGFNELEQRITKARQKDLANFATKQDINRLDKKIDSLELNIQKDIQRLSDIFATKKDLERFATKEDLEKFATKEDLSNASYNLMDHMDIKFAVMQVENRKFQKENNAKFSIVYKHLGISF